jgi:uncharacterized protein YgiM (DUF1202 family)
MKRRITFYGALLATLLFIGCASVEKQDTFTARNSRSEDLTDKQPKPDTKSTLTPSAPTLDKPTQVIGEKSAPMSPVEKKIEPTQPPSKNLPSASNVAKTLIVIKTANIRSEPNTKSKIITTLKKGTAVEYLDKSGKWFKIRLSTGKAGWVFNSLVSEQK